MFQIFVAILLQIVFVPFNFQSEASTEFSIEFYVVYVLLNFLKYMTTVSVGTIMMIFTTMVMGMVSIYIR